MYIYEGRMLFMERIFKAMLEDIKKNYKIFLVVTVLIGIMVVMLDKFCLIAKIFGMPCPGCGMSRAVFLMFNGKISESIAMHPVLPLLIVFVIYAGIRKYVMNNRAIKDYYRYAVIFSVIMLSVYIYRMYRYFPDVEPLTFYEENILGNVIEKID